MIAYGTQRTLILESQNWRYATGGWETVFKPVSETCTDRTGASTGHWSGKSHASTCYLGYQVHGCDYFDAPNLTVRLRLYMNFTDRVTFKMFEEQVVKYQNKR